MAWLFGFDNRIKFSIDHTKIGEDLTHFPVTLSLSSTFCSEVFSELWSDANRFKIAFTKDDGITELYGEIEQFDCVNSKAVYHISKNDWTIVSGTNTDFYMYYDSSHADNTNYIGDIGSTPGENVWNSNFKMVQHMVDNTTSTILDSTNNNNDGTKKAANEPIEIEGEIGKGQDFDGVDDHIQLDTKIAIGAKTLEVISNALDAPHDNRIDTILGETDSTNSSYGNLFFWSHTDHIYKWGIFKNVTSEFIFWFESTVLSVGTNYYVVGAWDGTTDVNAAKLYVDGTVNAQATATQIETVVPTYNTKIGDDFYANADRNYKGILRELRISNIARSAAWIKATYDSLFGNLVTKVESGVNAIFFGFNF